MNHLTRHVGILAVSLHIPASQSLKEKRMVLRSIKDRIRSRFNVSVAELDGHDKWQVATLGFAMIANERRLLESTLQEVLLTVESNLDSEVCEKHLEIY